MRSTGHIRPYMARICLRGAFLIFMSMLVASISLGAAPSQAGVSWDYKLLGKLNSSQNKAGTQTILITGSGSFDRSQSIISGGGNYTILDKDASVVGSGTWTAMTFDNFTPMTPGGSPGEGGHLELEALFKGTGLGAQTVSWHVVVQCSMWGPQVGPPGYPWSPDFVEAGPYTIHQTGGVMFNLNQ